MGVYRPHWLVQWSCHCSHMCIPVPSPWLPGYSGVVEILLVMLTMAGLFPYRPRIWRWNGVHPHGTHILMGDSDINKERKLGHNLQWEVGLCSRYYDIYEDIVKNSGEEKHPKTKTPSAENQGKSRHWFSLRRPTASLRRRGTSGWGFRAPHVAGTET